MIRSLGLFFLAYLTNNLLGQTIATTENGQTAVLFEDGTYKTGVKAKSKDGGTVIIFLDGTYFRLGTVKNKKNVTNTIETLELDNATEINLGDIGEIEGPQISNNNEIEIVTPSVRASFPGGESSFRDYVRNEFQYPDRCFNEKISGSVVLKFLVDQSGRISRISAMKETASCPEFTREAIRVLKNSPRWIPGQNKKGRFVASWREMPISIPYK